MTKTEIILRTLEVIPATSSVLLRDAGHQSTDASKAWECDTVKQAIYPQRYRSREEAERLLRGIGGVGLRPFTS